MSKKTQTDIGVVGLGVMGASLAQNMQQKGFAVSVYNRDPKITDAFLKKQKGKEFVAAKSYKTFIASIKKPRKVFIMVTAGGPVDAVIKDLSKHLDKGDTIIDGGNSFYKDTQRRHAQLKKKGIHFLGCGVSGGEEGALHGPSLMPGGSKVAWTRSRKILSAIAAKDFSDNPCVTYLGDNGAGHYVKMVHNGIEYGIMQMIAETYDVLTKSYLLNPKQIGDIFKEYSGGRLESFLFDITVPVLQKKDDKKCCDYLIHQILDKAGSKGTGKWTAMDALDRGVAVPTIAQAVFARYVSAEKDMRKQLEKVYDVRYKKIPMRKSLFIRQLERALYAGILGIFAQGFHLIAKTSEEEKWDIDLAEVSRIWQGGCIIRAKVLKELQEAYAQKKYKNKHVFTLPFARKEFGKDLGALRDVVSLMVETGVPVPGFSSSLYYVESMIEERLPAHVIQGLRDYFGAHTYERIDMKGRFHTDWDA